MKDKITYISSFIEFFFFHLLGSYKCISKQYSPWTLENDWIFAGQRQPAYQRQFQHIRKRNSSRWSSHTSRNFLDL